MTTNQPGLPQGVARAYWAEVGRVLREKHLPGQKFVKSAIQAYRKALRDAGVGDGTCHDPIDETVQGSVQGGYATSPSTTSEAKPRARERKSFPS